MNIIFLDIDGVLTQNSMSNIFNPKNVEALRTLLIKLPQMGLVITSNRRIRDMHLAQFRDLFHKNGIVQSRLIGTTPVLLKETTSGLVSGIFGRGAEIQAFIEGQNYRSDCQERNNKPFTFNDFRIENFAIIDDQPEELQAFVDKLFLTQFPTGLTLEIVEKVIQYFNKD